MMAYPLLQAMLDNITISLIKKEDKLLWKNSHDQGCQNRDFASSRKGKS